MAQRLYTCSDLALLDAAREFANSLAVDLADFTAMDPSIDNAFLTAFDSDIQAAEVVPNSASVEGEMRTLTEAVAASREAAYSTLRPVSYYIDVLWPGRKAYKKEFGLERMGTLRQSESKLLAAMNLCAAKLAEHSVQFLAIGMTQAQIDAVGTARDALEAANNTQEEFRNTIPRVTDGRIALYNTAYGRMQRINALSKVVYAGDESSLNRYKMPRTSGAGERHTIQPGNVYSHRMTAPQPADNWTVHNFTTDYPLMVCMQPGEEQNCADGLTVLPQALITFQLQDIGPVQEYLTFTNHSPEKVIDFEFRKGS